MPKVRKEVRDNSDRHIPCPCNHHKCRGQYRDPRTVKKHAKLRADREAASHSRLVADDDDPEPARLHQDEDKMDEDLEAYLHDEADEYARNPAEDVENWDRPIIEDDDDEHTYPDLGDVILQVFDWKSKHKATKSSSSDMWDFIRTLLPPNDSMGTYASLKSILNYHRMETMKKEHVCVNMCVAFVNPQSKELSGEEYQNADKQYCPVCFQPRYLADNVTPRRVVYNLPMKYWLQDLFNRPDVVPHLLNNLPPTMFPSGHVRRSDGYREKVTDNPNINSDARNQALSLSADGLPYFKDQNSAGGWAVSLINENLAEGNMGHNASFVHLACLVPSDYLSQASSKAKIVKTKRY